MFSILIGISNRHPSHVREGGGRIPKLNLYSNSLKGSVCPSVCYQTRPRPMNRLKKKIDGYIPPIAEHVLIYMAF